MPPWPSAGALVGFLLWNRPPARIYLGDAGSYLVGTALAILLALTATEHGTEAPTAGALLFVAVPVADTTVAIVRRWRAGQPLRQGDRGHVYDQLVDRGWTTGRGHGRLRAGPRGPGGGGARRRCADRRDVGRRGRCS